MNTRLIILDIDGVMTRGETQAFDLAFLGQLAAMNRAARDSPDLPAITICSGRPAPYVEAMLQAIDGHLPAVFENGAGLYIPNGYRFLPHPDLATVLKDGGTMRAVRSRLEKTLLSSQSAYLQPGKEYSLSLFSHDEADTPRLQEQVTEVLGSLADGVELVYSASCLNVLPRGMSKGKGLMFLAEHTGYAREEMLGAGDSDNDLPFLSLVGASAAPANANQAVKGLVDYVASRPTSDGVQDIFRHFGLS